MKKRRIVSFLLLAATVFLAAISHSAQQIDPFYQSLLEKAQKSFLARDYEEAARNFEIAAFGLAGDKTLQAKAYVYLGLCRYYLKDMPATEKSLRQAAALLGEEGLSALEIYESAWPDFNRLVAFFNLAKTQNEALPQEVEKPLPPNPYPQSAKPDEPKKQPEEKAAKVESQNAQAGQLSDPAIDEIKEGDLLPLDLVDTPPVVIMRISADYPEHARSSGIEGTVMVDALVSEKGDVIMAKVTKNIRNAVGFDRAALHAVRRWKFEPASIKGIKVRVWIPVAIEFKKTPSPSE